VHKLPAKWLSSLWRSTKCVVWGCIFVLKGHTLQQIVCLGRWSSNWEITRFHSDGKKWDWLTLNSRECSNPISTATVYFVCYQDDGIY
jgi:hypothetical protein